MIVGDPLACGCCGGGDILTEVAVNIWRCDKHIGRLPCLVPGCGRTAKIVDDETYDHVWLCGRHWRMAPRHMRERVKQIRKIGRKRDWPEKEQRLFQKLWWRCARSVLDGATLDIDEITRMFG